MALVPPHLPGKSSLHFQYTSIFTALVCRVEIYVWLTKYKKNTVHSFSEFFLFLLFSFTKQQETERAMLVIIFAINVNQQQFAQGNRFVIGFKKCLSCSKLRTRCKYFFYNCILCICSRASATLPIAPSSMHC